VKCRRNTDVDNINSFELQCKDIVPVEMGGDEYIGCVNVSEDAGRITQR
jgi:hypothetical protein